jgi:hypothetical protein
MSFQLLLKTSPVSAIPKANTKAYRLLALLANGKPVPEIHILIELGGNCRSQLQALKNDTYGHWNIIPEFDDKGIIVSRRLDPRHLSGDPMLDARARAERRVELKRESLTLSIHEKARTSKARAELSEAEDHLLGLESGNN